MTVWRYLRERDAAPDVRVFDRADDRLGRHQIHRPKARLHDARKGLFWSRMPTKRVRHVRYAPVWDQGEIGSCTCDAALGLMSTGPFWTSAKALMPPSPTQSGLPAFSGQQGVRPYVQADAYQLYREATRYDDDVIPGHWEPTDEGSTGDASMAALRARGLISGWVHSFRWNDTVRLLARQPISIGIPWFESMMEPDARGYLTPAGKVDGGHQVVVDELIPVLDARGRVRDYDIGGTNSWTAQWGPIGGRFLLSGPTARALLADGGDVVSPKLG